MYVDVSGLPRRGIVFDGVKKYTISNLDLLEKLTNEIFDKLTLNPDIKLQVTVCNKKSTVANNSQGFHIMGDKQYSYAIVRDKNTKEHLYLAYVSAEKHSKPDMVEHLAYALGDLLSHEYVGFIHGDDYSESDINAIRTSIGMLMATEMLKECGDYHIEKLIMHASVFGMPLEKVFRLPTSKSKKVTHILDIIAVGYSLGKSISDIIKLDELEHRAIFKVEEEFKVIMDKVVSREYVDKREVDKFVDSVRTLANATMIY